MIGFWIFMIVVCICVTVIMVVYILYQRDMDYYRYKEISNKLNKILDKINVTDDEQKWKYHN